MNIFYLKLFIAMFFGSFIFLSGADFAKAEILLPVAAGDLSEWTGAYTQVDEYPNNNGDTGADYNFVATATQRQSYSLKDTVHTVGTIKNIKVVAYVKAETVAEYLNVFLRIGTNNYDGSNCTNITTTEYNECSYTWTQDPSDASAWSIGDLNSLQAGFQSIANGTWDATEMRVTQLYAQVEYDSEINTAKYHVVQKILPVSSGETVNDQFNFYIADDLDEVKSAYIEIKGLSLPTASLTMDVSVDNTGAPNPTGSPRLKTYTIDASNRNLSFKIIYNATDYFKTFVNGPGDYGSGGSPLYLNIKVNGVSVYLLNAKLYVTYSWVKPPAIVGAYKQSGELISSTFDTGAAGGSAYNSIIWRGTKPAGTRIKFQLAASGNQAGPFNFVGGSACDSNNWWEPENNSAQEIKCFSQFNNKRYFRYKIRLESNPPNYDSTPTVDDVVINFSP